MLPADFSNVDQKKAKAKLMMTIYPTLYVHIKNEDTVESLSLVKQVEAVIRRLWLYKENQLIRALISIRLDNCDSMTSHVSQIVETTQILKGTGFEIKSRRVCADNNGDPALTSMLAS